MPNFPLFADPYVLGAGQTAQVWTLDIDSGELTMLVETSAVHLEAPNWSLDGETLIISGEGKFWSVPAAGGELTQIQVEELPPVTNDHVLDPDGRSLIVTSLDGQIYRVPLAGGTAEPLTADPTTSHFLHGLSADGTTVAYIRLPFGDFGAPGALVLAKLDGTGATVIPTGSGHVDGPEFSSDGEWIYVNSEAFTSAPGHAQVARVRADGTGFERLVESDRVDWFPHIAPSDDVAAYLSYPAGTTGHPGDLRVLIKVVKASNWAEPILEVDLFGGQGTINVNSWSPDGRRFAFVAFPIGDMAPPAVTRRAVPAAASA